MKLLASLQFEKWRGSDVAVSSIAQRASRFLPFLLVLLACLQGMLFLAGYRLTADDVEFQYQLMQGWQAVWDFTWLAATSQGRIVHLLDVPFSIVAAYYADVLWFRVFYTSLYFGCFALVAYYVSRLTASRITALIILVLVSLHPLDYFHLPPNAYPAHLTLPFLLILGARIGLLWTRSLGETAHAGLQTGLLMLCLVGMLFSEYAFVFAGTLMGAEFLVRLASRHNEQGRWLAGFRTAMFHRHTLTDLLLLGIFLTLYFGFRAAFPSTYEGNQLAADLDVSAVVRTLAGHVYGGTSLASLSRNADQLRAVVGSSSAPELVAGIAIFIGTFAAGLLCLCRLLAGPGDSQKKRRSIGLVLAALSGAILVTLPVALVYKYQAWCGDLAACIFLDSRISYLGIGTAIAAALMLGVAWLRRGVLVTLVPLSLSGGLAMMATLTFFNNLLLERDMRLYVAGWERAQRLACAPAEQIEELGMMLPKLLDPGQRISMSPDFDRIAYWRSYIAEQGKAQACDGTRVSLADLYPPMNVNPVEFGQGSNGVAYLGSGWYTPEGWGVWSQGHEADIYLPVDKPVAALSIDVSALILPMHLEQPIEISVNGTQALSHTLRRSDVERIELPLPDVARKEVERLGVLILQLRFLSPVSQKVLGVNEDNRMLALGLRSIMLH